MTKSEIRALSVAKMKLSEDSIVYDVGAGTGSVTVEMALVAVEGTVYAVEKEEAAADRRRAQDIADKYRPCACRGGGLGRVRDNSAQGSGGLYLPRCGDA